MHPVPFEHPRMFWYSMLTGSVDPNRRRQVALLVDCEDRNHASKSDRPDNVRNRIRHVLRVEDIEELDDGHRDKKDYRLAEQVNEVRHDNPLVVDYFPSAECGAARTKELARPHFFFFGFLKPKSITLNPNIMSTRVSKGA